MSENPEKKQRKKDKPVPADAFNNQQLSIFQEFLANTSDEKKKIRKCF